MLYTVKEVANLSGTTIKTLYYYQKIGLLLPQKIAENGYRYYGDKELKRLQQILFYRELDFSLDRIKVSLENEPNRLKCLYEQQELLKTRKQKLDDVLKTLEKTIKHERNGKNMNKENMFIGLNEKEWENALTPQNKYLDEKYNFKIDTGKINASEMNEKATEASEFMNFMAKSLKNNLSPNDDSVMDAIKNHINFLKKDIEIDAKGFAAQSRFFLTDEFHRGMLENQQTGLSYFICIAAENYASL
ncbi:MerR family transcriptional regulator [Clostridium sp. AL.422]|uniref:MerR family transcriptional regulator n=1 Tax=Clostridium TaxID=1485 RepID=UPI00293DB138|nr:MULTISPECIES: MerR family transcriptional regulator [unclassified Clostridium]MDV4152365.1 MerR family transcriptional regulator [Clostridium sp. AL.422]